MSLAARRPLGRSGVAVSPICLGGNVFGWTADEAASFAVLDAFAGAGGNFVDTANSYSTWVPGNRGGESEEIIGRWMRTRGNRDRIVVATKVGSPMSGQPGGLTRKLVRAGVTASLRRLQVDVIDLYYTHWPDPGTPVEETLGALDELVREGFVRAIGASNEDAARLRIALDTSARYGLARFEAVQPPYNLIDRAAFEGGLEALCAEEELGVAPYYALARGFLSGKYRPGRPLPASPRAAGVASAYMNHRGFAVLDALDRVGAAHGATPGQVALAWLIARPTITAPITSATSAEHAGELAVAAALTLGDDELRLLDGAGATSSARRFPQHP